MLRALPVVLLLFGCGKNVPEPLPACRCSISRHTVERDFMRADYVFVGTAIGIQNIPPSPYSRQSLKPKVQSIRFEVARQFKGVPSDELVVYTDRVWACSYEFTVSESYLVYAWVSHRFKNELETSACIRTAPLNEAREDLRKLPALAQQEEEQ